MKKLSIVYILTPIIYGGSEKVTLTFLENINRNKYDINLILLTRPWEDKTSFEKKLNKYNYTYFLVPVSKFQHKFFFVKDFFRVPRVAYKIYSILRKSKFDLIHTTGYFADICGQPVAKLLKIPGISTCHGFIYNDRKLKFYYMLDKIVLRLCRKIIAVSDGIRTELLRSGLDDSRIEVIQNAVVNYFNEQELHDLRNENRSNLSIRPDEFVLGFVGRLSEEKGLVYLIEAISEVINNIATVRLLIVGDGPLREELEQLVRDKGLGSNIIFTGFQENSEDWFPSFDLFVLPSLTEGTPMVLLEAMAIGIPVIASQVGGIPNIINNEENGILVPSKNSKALSQAILKVYQSQRLRKILSLNAKKTIKKKYNIKNWIKKIEDIYQN